MWLKRERPLQPFAFGGEPIERLDPIILAAGIEAAKRRVKVQSNAQRYQQARQATREAGVQIHISRPVLNQRRDFASELAVWQLAEQEGSARRRNYGALAMTVFNNTQQPLRSFDSEKSAEEWQEELERRHPALFGPTATIPVKSIVTFGGRDSTHIALDFKHGKIHDEQTRVRSIVAPELLLGASHLPEHQLHLSLGVLLRPTETRVEEMKQLLWPIVPKAVTFGPLQVKVIKEKPSHY